MTGIVTNVEAVSAMLHRHGALAFWDYAAAAPYVEIDMRAKADGPGYLDAVFISPHKFIGGPGTPGVLVARRDLFTNRVPIVPGGGTVAYVNPVEHDYLDDIETREEGGTPDIIGAIRTGLVFQLKEAVGTDEIKRREKRLVQRAIAAWSDHPGIEILGNPDTERLSIVSLWCATLPTLMATATTTCTTTSWLRCSTTCSASSRAVAVRVRVPMAIGSWASTSTSHMSSSARSPAAARASSPAGFG